MRAIILGSGLAFLIFLSGCASQKNRTIASTGSSAEYCRDSNGILRSLPPPASPAKNSTKPRKKNKEPKCDDFEIALMSQEKALSACPAGTHLPSIRELAELGETWGSEGIFDPQTEMDETVSGHKKISPKDEDEFLYRKAGYNREYAPPSEFRREEFWSSSTLAASSNFAYYFEGVSGNIFDDGTHKINAVWCAPNR